MPPNNGYECTGVWTLEGVFQSKQLTPSAAILPIYVQEFGHWKGAIQVGDGGN